MAVHLQIRKCEGVAAAISEHTRWPEKIVATVSTDLRRLPLLWRLPGDLPRVRRMAAARWWMREHNCLTTTNTA